MPSRRKFLVVDDNADGRSLLARTLLRKFPQSLTIECADAASAIRTAAAEKLDAVVVHRAGETDAPDLISRLRSMLPNTPIIYVSGIDGQEAALRGGATSFLNYEAWLRLGTVVAEALETAWPTRPASAAAS